MFDNSTTTAVTSLDLSNKYLTEIPKDLFTYKDTLINLNISSNPLIDLDSVIKNLQEFKYLTNLEINIETGAQAKKIIDALPNLEILNSHPIHGKIEKNNDNNNQKNIIKKEEHTILMFSDKKNEENFSSILDKIKEFSEITKEKYENILFEYNKLISNINTINNDESKNMKNTLEICSFMNKILIDLIREAQENNIISISSIKPLLDAQELNENLRSDCEEKIKNILMNKTKRQIV